MAYVFYLIQLMSPNEYYWMPPQAPVSPVERVYTIGTTQVSKHTYLSHKASVGCLTDALFYESRNQSERGNKLVAQVVVNRSRSPHFPDTVCKVLKQRVKGRYQYSYHLNKDKTLHLKRKNRDTYQKLYNIANKVLTDNFEGRRILTKAQYYKRCDVKSEFFDKLKYLGREQEHCFFTVNETT